MVEDNGIGADVLCQATELFDRRVTVCRVFGRINLQCGLDDLCGVVVANDVSILNMMEVTGIVVHRELVMN